MFRVDYLRDYSLRRLPKTPITLKIPIGYTLDPVTRQSSKEYNIIETLGYVGYFSADTLKNNHEKLSIESRKIILKNTNVTEDTIVNFEGKDYEIAIIKIQGDVVILGVNPK